MSKPGENMTKAVECIRCHAPMEPGFVPDYTENRYSRQNWWPGEPQKSFWTGFKIERDQVIPVTTFRCSKCGYLESYALRQDPSDQ